MATRRAAPRRSRRDKSSRGRRLPGYARTARPTRPAFLARLPGNAPGSAHRVCAGAHSASARAQKSMDPREAPVPNLICRAEDENSAGGQQLRPSVTWNLDSPVAGAVATKATASAGTYPASAVFRHSRLSHRGDTHVGSQPKICFLRPRTAQPLVLFRAADKTKKKMSYLYDHLKKKFMTDQLRKLGRWRRESTNIRQYLDSIRGNKVPLKAQPNRKDQPP
ncbi:uncharacterized protein C5orf52 homolog isoform X2 [Moschus berezovskii]|uniref:uncharacterized protein C5orf52 homolog isoform X2 n=1 Tax=Moschus berezovskii TaxID=68408 RepID=UPI002444F230|nr:uncharacterized protein C5orf52 homolog isoform X2 [Moschus berezovskii]